MHNAQCIISYTDNMVETKQHTLCHPERSRRRSRRISSGASLRHHRPQAYTQNVIPSVVEESLTTPMAHLFIKTAPCAVFPAILHCSFFIAKEAASLPLLLCGLFCLQLRHLHQVIIHGVHLFQVFAHIRFIIDQRP